MERKLPNVPATFTYVKIYPLANELYGMGNFTLASDMILLHFSSCKALQNLVIRL